MPRSLRYLGQVAVYLLIAAILGTFATWPSYRSFPEDRARITLNFSHVGQRAGECRRLTAEEIADLPPNMRKPTVCPRGRLPLRVELYLDDELLFRDSLAPSGLSGDGPAQIHQRFVVEPGKRRLTVRMADSGRAEGFDYERSEVVELDARRDLVVDFRSEAGGFVFL